MFDEEPGWRAWTSVWRPESAEPDPDAVDILSRVCLESATSGGTYKHQVIRLSGLHGATTNATGRVECLHGIAVSYDRLFARRPQKNPSARFLRRFGPHPFAHRPACEGTTTDYDRWRPFFRCARCRTQRPHCRRSFNRKRYPRMGPGDIIPHGAITGTKCPGRLFPTYEFSSY